ncbi:3-hydroxyacyl-CoA dehydrogenase NAD-binding domain-containing protein [Marinobacter salarius]|uniref:3-hydroxyacyl-CoA dehydrogenase NAD-binding domain-containing protein n=1 Tax=Marinobacter salarius TaxID=1420917 RepID=UPI0032F06804
MRTVGIVGTGVIGSSWASWFLARGLNVRATDPAPGAEEAFINRAMTTLQWLEDAGLAEPRTGTATFHDSLEDCLDGVDFVQENALEDEAFKIDLLKRIDALLAPEVIIATSTSALMPSRLQSGCEHPGRVIVAHPFNPPHLLPLVEIVGGAQTDKITIETAMDFYKSIGKRPVHVRKEVPGHIANRLTSALWREALDLVITGVAMPEDIDEAVRSGPGPRMACMGPFTIYHLAGGPGGFRHYLAHLGKGQEYRWSNLADRTSLTERDRQMLIPMVDSMVAQYGDDLEVNRDKVLKAILDIAETLRPQPSITGSSNQS